MKAKLIMLIILFNISGCDSNKHKELSKENLVKLESGALGISLMVPKESTFFENSKKVSINLNPGGRKVRQFSIEKAASTIRNSKYIESLTFGDRITLNYFTFEKVGGSGGIHYIMEGTFKFEGEPFKLTSYDQEELGKGHPEFCLTYLRTIKRLTHVPAKNTMD